MFKLFFFVVLLLVLVWAGLKAVKKFMPRAAQALPAASQRSHDTGSPAPAPSPPILRGGKMGLREGGSNSEGKGKELFRVHREHFYGFSNGVLITDAGEYEQGMPCQWGLVVKVSDRAAIIIETDGMRGYICADDKAPASDVSPAPSPSPSPLLSGSGASPAPRGPSRIDYLDRGQALSEGLLDASVLDHGQTVIESARSTGHVQSGPPSPPQPGLPAPTPFPIVKAR